MNGRTFIGWFFVVAILMAPGAGWADTIFDIWSMTRNGLDPRNLTNTPLVNEGPPSVGLEGRIAFTAEEHLYVMDANAGIPVQVPLPAFDAVRTPKWSRDGNWLTFTAGVHSQGEIYVVRPDGTGLRQVTNTGWAVSPSFSPDGSTIAFTKVYGHLFTVGFDGNGMTDFGFSGGNSEWSPDGTKISYTNYANPTYESDIFVYDLASQTSTKITDHASGEAFATASWSPDSTELLVSKWSSGQWDLWRMNADGTTPVNLTPDSGNSDDVWGCWSLDGQSVVYMSGEIPEPATLALLALGGLALVRRRRK